MATIEELNVKISADVKGLKRGVDQANRRVKALGKRTKKSTKEIDKGLKSLGGRFQNLASSIAIVQGPLGGVAGRFTSISALLKRTNVRVIGTIAAFTALTVVLGKSVALFIPFEQTIFRLGAVLRATGRDAEISVDQLDQFAIKLGAATLTSREAVLDAQATLATFNAIKTDQFERILTIAQDVSSVFGGDLKTNTIILARALTAPGEAFTILERRVGKFTEAEKKLLKELQDTGRLMEAQEILLNKLVGTTGAAEAAAAGLAGQLDTLGENFRRALIPLAVITPAVFLFKSAIKGLSKTFDAIARIGERFGVTAQTVTGSIKSIDNATKKLGDTGKETFEKILTPAAQKMSEEISLGLSNAIVESRNNLEAFANFANNLLNKIAADILAKNVTAPLIEGILKLIPGFTQPLPGKALGGPVQANQPLIVGEKGPELLIPNTSGTIVPNNRIGGGAVTIVQNFTIVSGAEINEIDRKIQAAAPIIQAQAMAGTLAAMRKGGVASREVGKKF